MERAKRANEGEFTLQNGVGGGALAALSEIRCPASGRTLRLGRAWPPGPGHLLLEYRDGDVSVAGQWFADPGRLGRVARQTAAVVPGQVAWDANVGVLVQRGGADRRLPALSEVLDDDAPTTLVVHRPERRAVLRRRRSGVTTYLKVVRPGRTPPGTVALRGPRLPEVLAVDPDRGTVEHTELAGASLHDLLGGAGADAGGPASVVRSFGAAGGAVRALHAGAPPAGLGTHRPGDEIDVTSRWVDLALAHDVLDVQARAQVSRALARLRAELGRLPTSPNLGVVHRDLHDKQVLVAGEDDVGLLDLDTLAIGDPALDVANLLVHLELRTLQGHCRADVAGSAGDAFVDGYRPDRALQERLGAYAGATRLRLACVYAFRPRWADVATRLLAPV